MGRFRLGFCAKGGDDESDLQRTVLGCLLGGAVGDALGAPVEFKRLDELKRRFGSEGVRSYTDPDDLGRITDDTQMTLFTAEGHIRSRVRTELEGRPDEPSVT